MRKAHDTSKPSITHGQRSAARPGRISKGGSVQCLRKTRYDESNLKAMSQSAGHEAAHTSAMSRVFAPPIPVNMYPNRISRTRNSFTAYRAQDTLGRSQTIPIAHRIPSWGLLNLRLLTGNAHEMLPEGRHETYKESYLLLHPYFFPSTAYKLHWNSPLNSPTPTQSCPSSPNPTNHPSCTPSPSSW
jgi:hypothetical protein